MKPVLFRQVGRDGDSIALFSVCLNLKRQIMRILFAVAYHVHLFTALRDWSFSTRLIPKVYLQWKV